MILKVLQTADREQQYRVMQGRSKVKDLLRARVLSPAHSRRELQQYGDLRRLKNEKLVDSFQSVETAAPVIFIV